MHLPVSRKRVAAVIVTGVAMTLASCATPPPPPPPPVAKAPAIPPKPYPPQGASPNYVLPSVGPDGKWVTVNTGVSGKSATWNLRAAYNVAALNCLRPQHAAILEGYKTFLTGHKRELMTAYKKVEADFKAKHGARGGLTQRDIYMTQVYNHFAFPPTLSEFCDGVLAMSLEAQSVPSAQLDAFAERKLPVLEAIFQDFYTRYRQYKADEAQWNATYGSLYAPQQAAVATAPASGLTLPQTGAPASSPQIVLPAAGGSTRP